MRKNPKILIILLGALGDIARGIVVLKPLKEKFPEAHITWLVEKKWHPFLALHPLIDDFIFFEKKTALKSISSYRKTIENLGDAQDSFDVTLDLSRHFKSGILSWLSKSKIRYGFHPQNAKEFNHIFQTNHIAKCSDSDSKVYHYLEFPKVLGAETKDIDFGLEKEELLSFLPSDYDQYGSKPCVSIILGSSWESKDWNFEGYRRLLTRLLSEFNYNILLLGDESKKLFAEELFTSTHDSHQEQKRVFALAGKTSLKELTALLAHSEFAVGPDSGPGHISSAVGTDYISLFGPTHPSRVAPFGTDRLIVQQNLSCMPCYKRKCPGMQHMCMHLLEVDDIFNKVYVAQKGVEA